MRLSGACVEGCASRDMRLGARSSYFDLRVDGARGWGGSMMFFREREKECQSAKQQHWDPATRLTEQCYRTCDTL